MKKFGLIALILFIAIQLVAQSGNTFTTREQVKIHKQQIRLIICDSLNGELTIQNQTLKNQVELSDSTFKTIQENQELYEIERLALLNEVEGQDLHIKKLNRKIKLLKIGMIGVGAVAVLVTARFLLIP